MAIDPEVISPSSHKGKRARRFLPRWAIYSAGGLVVLFLIGLAKAMLPMIGMGLLLTYIWSKSSDQRY